MWSQKMKAILIQMRCVRALNDSWPQNMNPARKTELEEVAWNTIFLQLSENVIRTIGETKISFELWTELEKKKCD